MSDRLKPLTQEEKVKAISSAKAYLEKAYSALDSGMWAEASWRAEDAIKELKRLATSARTQSARFKVARISAGCRHKSKWRKDAVGNCHCNDCGAVWKDLNNEQ